MNKGTYKIRYLVDRIKRGEIALPALQRSYVWRSTQVRDLLDSLYRGYPTGSFLLWQPREKDKPTRGMAISQDGGQWQELLLDGQQRLLSLAAILEGDPIKVKGSKRPIEIMFNMNHPDDVEDRSLGDNQEENEAEEDPEHDPGTLQENLNNMVFIVKSKALENDENWVSVTEAIKKDSMDLLEQRGIEVKGEKFRKFYKRLEKVKEIEKYEYDVVLLKDMSYETVTKIFVRVNSAGTKLRSWDLALSQITVTWQDALEDFERYVEEKKNTGVRGFDIKIAVRGLAAFATNQAKFNALHRLPLDKLQQSWKEATRGLDFSLDFVHGMGFDNLSLLSSPYFLVTIAMFAKERNYKISREDEKKLRFWLYMGSIKGRYSVSMESTLSQDIGLVKKADDLISYLRARAGRFRIEPSDLEGMHSRNPFFKLLFVLMKHRGIKDWHSRAQITLESVSKSNRLNAHHIFPKAQLKKAGKSSKEIDDIANLTFITDKTNKQIGQTPPSKYLAEIEADVLEPHLMPKNRNLWKLERYDDFLAARRELIAEEMNKFLRVEDFEKKSK